MSFFSLKKKQNIEKETPAYTCSCQTADTAKMAENDHTATENNDCRVKVLGSGCKNCHALLENTKNAIKTMGLAEDVEYVTDMQRVMQYGAMRMPVLVVDEKVVSAGKVLKTNEVIALLHQSGLK